MGNRCSDLWKHVQRQTTETVFTQGDAPSSSLALFSVRMTPQCLCPGRGRPIHDGQTSSLCFFHWAFTALTVWPVTCGRCVSAVDVFRPHTSSFVLYSLRTHCAEIWNVLSSFWINLLVQKFYFMSNFGIFHRFSYRNGNNRFVFSNRLLVTKNLKMPFKTASLFSYMCRHITGSSAEVGRWLLYAPMRRRSE